MDHTKGVPVLKVWSILEELKSRMKFQNLLKQYFEILRCTEFLSLIWTNQVKCSIMSILVFYFSPNILKFRFFQCSGVRFACSPYRKQDWKVARQTQDITYQFLGKVFRQLLSLCDDGIDLTTGGGFSDVIKRFSFGEVKLWNLAGWLFGDWFRDKGTMGQVNIGLGHLLIFILFFRQ